MTYDDPNPVTLFPASFDEWSRFLPKCVNCGHIIQPAIYAWKEGTGPPPDPGTWTHGVGRTRGFWQGQRCPGSYLKGAPPKPDGGRVTVAPKPEPLGHGCRLPDIRRSDHNRVWVCSCSQAWVARHQAGLDTDWWEWERWNPWK